MGAAPESTWVSTVRSSREAVSAAPESTAMSTVASSIEAVTAAPESTAMSRVRSSREAPRSAVQMKNDEEEMKMTWMKNTQDGKVSWKLVAEKALAQAREARQVDAAFRQLR